jgi:hypothetical protein
MKNTFVIISILFVVVCTLFAYKSYEYGKAYKDEKTEYVKVLNFEERLLKAKEWIFTESEWAKRKVKSEQHLGAAETAYDNILLMSIFVIIFSIIYMLIVAVVAIQYKKLYLYLGIGFAIVALPCLLIGISIPMMEISAFTTELTIPLEIDASSYLKDVPLIGSYADLLKLDLTQVFHGRMYYFYQSKSVFDLIFLLIKDGNWLVAISIIAFSVIIPIFKLLVTIVYGITNKTGISLGVFKFSYALGKWSMADVFVAALFLGFLSFSNMNEGVETEALSLAGMYYFLGYCILSLVSSILINAALKKNNDSNTGQTDVVDNIIDSINA